MGPLVHLFAVLAPPRCAGCDARLSREAVFCAACLVTLEPPPPLPEAVTASFSYGGALADAIRSAKFGGRLDRLRLLAHAIGTGVPARALVDVVAPVPLHPRRLRERGFDQAAILARAVAAAIDRPCDLDLLRRVVDTPHLASLDSHGRAAAVEGAFVARRVQGVRVLLIDDVRTTGATLDAGGRAIAEAGGSARAHVLAATPRA